MRVWGEVYIHEMQARWPVQILSDELVRMMARVRILLDIAGQVAKKHRVFFLTVLIHPEARHLMPACWLGERDWQLCPARPGQKYFDWRNKNQTV
jgi:hypothetical protein